MTHPAPKPGIMDVSPYIGGEGRVAGVARLVRLASNENPLGCSPKATAAYVAAAEDLHRYPDGGAAALRAAIGEKYGMDPARIVCGAGSDELIALLCFAYAGAGDEVLYSRHGFLKYPINAKLAGATPVAVDEDDLRTDTAAILKAVTARTKIIFLANPNNPTGSWNTGAELRALAAGLPRDVLLVIDAAYAEFAGGAEGYADGRALVDEFPNVAMLRTFSKVHGLAALRLGWGYFPAAVADVVNRMRGPFNVTAPAQAAGIAALADDDFVRRTVEMARDGMKVLRDGFTAMGVKVYPSAGNFLLCDFGPRAEELRVFLKDRGIFIRQMGVYGLPETLRITVGLLEDNAALLDAVAQFRKPNI